MRRMRTFRADPRSVHAARRFAVDALDGTPAPALEAVELMVSELATNCIRHEQASFDVTVVRSGREIRVEVTDSGNGSPIMRSPGPEEPSGRGLQIVDMLSERWGVQPKTPSGKTVWFTLDVPPPRTTSAARAGAWRQSADRTAATERPPAVQRRDETPPGPAGAVRASERRVPMPRCPVLRSVIVYRGDGSRNLDSLRAG